MPELPEVETVKNVLIPIVKNQTIKEVEVLREQTIISGAKEFRKALKDQTFLDVTRIGKFLIFHLTNDIVFLSHLRMEGKYFEFDEKDENGKHARVIFHLTNGHKLVYDDSRCFGIIKLTNEANYRNEKEIAQLGKEPFDIDDKYIDYLLKKCQKSSHPIKSTLLDQTLISGLGNIYADEVLYASNIYPLRPSKDIGKKEWKELVKNAVIILNKAIEAGGSTIRSYHPGKDISGEFQNELHAYGHKDERCEKCHSHFHFTFVGGRGTTYCPECQPLKKDVLVIGITGKVASGKSTILKVFEDEGIKVVSSDEIVEKLYQNNGILRENIEKAFSLKFDHSVDKDILRDYIKAHPKDQKKLEKMVHPLVIEEAKKEISKLEKGMIALEVPLLYESKMDALCDFVIGVDITPEKQLERLKKRNPSSAIDLLKINEKSKFDVNKDKVDYLILNDKSENELIKESKRIISKLQSHLN